MSLIYKNESYKIIGACMEVHRELGCGFLESIYQEALAKEFILQNIIVEREKQILIDYKGFSLDKHFFVDFICFDEIILELKATDILTSKHEAQVINYLKATNMKLGLLVNFGNEKLEYKRLVRNITN